MPLFSSKFSQRKTEPRKSPLSSSLHRELAPQQSQQEFGLDYGPLVLKLGNVENTFENGQWTSDHVTGGGGNASKEMQKLKKLNEDLKGENNLLKLKVEILLDMLAEATAETHLQSIEIEQLKASSTHKKSPHKQR